MTPSNPAPARIITLRPTGQQPPQTSAPRMPPGGVAPVAPARAQRREPLWRHIIGDVLRRERLTQERTLKDVSESARISMPYLSEVERGRKEASSEVLAAAAAALGMRLVDLLERAHRELESSGEDDSSVVTLVTSVSQIGTRHTGLSGNAGRTTGSVSLAA